MRWIGRRESGNVEDRRGSGGGGLAVGGGIGTVVIAIIVYLLGGDPTQITQNTGIDQTASQPVDPANDEAGRFVKVVLADTEDVWTKLFADQGQTYPKPVLVLFRGGTSSGCGMASAASGPFYCPADEKLYIDLSFYDELRERFNAPGDFAMAYVIAHEVGHHIQHQLGLTDQVDRARGRVSREQYNRMSVRLELQADFLAGVWAHHAQKMKNILEQGDIEEAMAAAGAIGDDRIQEQTQGHVNPESFTHGSSAQRVYWFKKGFQTGDMKQGDTFNSREDANLQ
ncbi:KPN_02809 family neutral zinc metallopeptidase [Larkinella soli]|uniref:KPN_02809 family neutral zinc metallopeptidase n=1 Tax=Larkinella soli TaxID=1770527 RepID=UPI000FFBC818|nr:neutral zinc metallopeptidase [Larkinella soli]